MKNEVTVYSSFQFQKFVIAALLSVSALSVIGGFKLASYDWNRASATVAAEAGSIRNILAAQLMTPEVKDGINKMVHTNVELQLENEKLIAANNALEAEKVALARSNVESYTAYRVAESKAEGKVARCEEIRASAIIPEATVGQAVKNHVVEPVREVSQTVVASAKSVWNMYEFQPQRVKQWVESVF